MKIIVAMDRQSGPIIGSRLQYDHIIAEPEVEELKYQPNAAGEITEEERERVHVHRARLVDAIAGNIARSLTSGLYRVLDDRPQTY